MTNKQKQLILDAIRHKPVARIPMMYRGDGVINQKLISHFGIKNTVYWDIEIAKHLGADFFTGVASLGDYTTYLPKYVGPEFACEYDICFFFPFGINSEKIFDDQGRFLEWDFFHTPPLVDASSISNVEKHPFPTVDWFDFDNYTTVITRDAPSGDAKNQADYIRYTDIKIVDDCFMSTYFLNSVFMIASYMRSMDKLLLDMVMNPKFAHALFDRVGQTCVDLSTANLARIGNRIEVFGMWDDFAMQTNMLVSPQMWREYLKPWYKAMIEEAKKYDLIVYFHCCGNLYEVIPDLIELGVDILDPIQTSARRMNLIDLKRDFGKDLCFHGGIDIQQLLAKGTPAQVRSEVKKIKDLFDGQGGMILGPSHTVTRDVPIENVMAIYE
jgi:uroporphyrinogen decarboxylase